MFSYNIAHLCIEAVAATASQPRGLGRPRLLFTTACVSIVACLFCFVLNIKCGVSCKTWRFYALETHVKTAALCFLFETWETF